MVIRHLVMDPMCLIFTGQLVKPYFSIHSITRLYHCVHAHKQQTNDEHVQCFLWRDTCTTFVICQKPTGEQ